MKTLTAMVLGVVIGLVAVDVSSAADRLFGTLPYYGTNHTTVYSGYGYGSSSYMSVYGQRMGNTTFYNGYGTGGTFSGTANQIGNTTFYNGRGPGSTFSGTAIQIGNTSFLNGYSSSGYRFSGTASRIGSMTNIYLFGR
ncbi:MAG TPA: hypothetical protein VMY42_18690 [Thermoguttaceae bacterium]|jgi:hypothetical protein|nr:hypothetical protein [Thermoguttaceae bacterium]